MFLATGTQKHREELSVLRAKEWASNITTAQFVERNQKLYAHPFGKVRMETHVYLGAQGEILSSCDTLDVDFALLDKAGDIVHERGLLLASVFTPEEKRKKGFCASMLEELFEEEGDKVWCLYSDIPPEFYEKYDFVPTSVTEKTKEIDFTVAVELCVPVELEAAVKGIQEARLRHLRTSETGLVPLPDTEWVDWNLLRFGLTAEWTRHPFPSTAFQVGQDFAIAAPDFVRQEIRVLYATSEDARLSAVRWVARETGIKKEYFWEIGPASGEDVSVPMAMSRHYPEATAFRDLQFGDWW